MLLLYDKKMEVLVAEAETGIYLQSLVRVPCDDSDRPWQIHLTQGFGVGLGQEGQCESISE